MKLLSRRWSLGRPRRPRHGANMREPQDGSVRIEVAGTGLTNRFGRWSNTKKIWEANHTR